MLSDEVSGPVQQSELSEAVAALPMSLNEVNSFCLVLDTREDADIKAFLKLTNQVVRAYQLKFH